MTLLKQLQQACNNGDCESAKILAPQMKSKDIFHALLFSVSQNKIDFTLSVYPYLSESDQGNMFCFAVEARHNAMVRALLPHSNPKFDSSAALQMASATRNQDVFDLLYPISQPSKALRVMKNHSRPFEYTMLEERIALDQVRQKISSAVKKTAVKTTLKRKL